MPLDAADYVTSQNFIVGVRNGTAYKLDPVTGAKLTSVVFDPRIIGGLSSVCYDPVTDTILAAGMMATDATGFTTPSSGIRHIVRLDTALNVGTSYDLTATIMPFIGFPNVIDASLGIVSGVNRLRSTASGIFAQIAVGSTVAAPVNWGIFLTPATLVPITGSGSVVSIRPGAYCIKGLVTYGCDPTQPRLYARDLSGGGFGAFYSECDFFGGNPAVWCLAAEYSDEADVIYVTNTSVSVDNDGSTIVKVTPTDDGFGNLAVLGTINIGRVNFNGVSIRRNSFNHLLYAAGAGDNSILVINPTAVPISGIAPGGFVVKTGFDFPVGLAFTPARSFAVQQGAQGLKEITLP